jgi:sigma-B regulation protein RsbU (phosphoserine phosphatase)
MLSLRSQRVLAIAFVGVLATYSGVWMYYIRAQQSANARGFEHAYTPSELAAVVTAVRPAGVAHAAGLRAGDRIVAIDHQPLDSYDRFLDAFGRTAPGRSLSLRVAGSDGTRTITFPLTPNRDKAEARGGADPRSSRVLAMVLTGYPLVFLAVASVVLLQRPADRDAWVMALAFGGLIASAPLLMIEPQMPSALRRFMVPVWVFLASTMPAALYYFFAVFPAASSVDRRLPWLKWLLGGAAVTAGAITAGICLAFGNSEGLWWVAEHVPAGTADWILPVYSIACVLLAFASLITNAFADAGTRRKTRVILAGAVLGFGPVMTLQVVIAIGGTGEPEEIVPFWVWALAAMAISLVPLSVAYAVVKHRVMELPVLLRRSARYVLVRQGAVTVAVLLGMFVTFVFAALLSRVFTHVGEGAQRAGLVVGALFGGVLATAGPRLWRPAQDRIDRAFFRGAYDARRILEQLARDSHVATDRDALACGIETALEAALQPEALYVYVRAADAPARLVAAGADADALAGVPLPLASPGLLELTKRGHPLVLTPRDLAPGGAFEVCAVLGPELLVPMLGRSGELEGLLVLAIRLSEEPYSGEDRALVAAAAAQAGLALENIRLAEAMARQLDAGRRRARELEIAKAVQAKLLPQAAPILATLDYAGRCIQARSIGGDYFDFISVGEGRFAFVLADISGKGISAALLMASLQASLRAQYTAAPADVRAVLRTVNRIFYGSTATNHYATLFFGVYDEPTRMLQYANCGHLPPILRRSTGRLERLQPTATVIGLFDEWDCRTAETTLGAGDTLVVFSDGASEAVNAADDEFGEERLAGIVDAQANADALALLDAIVAAVTEHGGTQQYDDLTLIVARGR